MILEDLSRVKAKAYEDAWNTLKVRAMIPPTLGQWPTQIFPPHPLITDKKTQLLIRVPTFPSLASGISSKLSTNFLMTLVDVSTSTASLGVTPENPPGVSVFLTFETIQEIESGEDLIVRVKHLGKIGNLKYLTCEIFNQDLKLSYRGKHVLFIVRKKEKKAKL